MSRFLVVSLICAVLTATGCSKGSSSKSPTAPVDNPDPPVITCEVAWTPSPSTIYLVAPGEDFVVTLLYVLVAHPPNGGGVQVLTDLPSGTTLAKGVTTAAHTTTVAGTDYSYVWLQGDQHVIRVTGHRPGQTKLFSVEVYRD